MDFSVPEKMKVILEMIREFMEKEVYPLELHFATKNFIDIVPELNKRREMVRQMELWVPQMPKDVGGMGLSVLEHGLVTEELARSPLGHYVFNCQAPDAGNMEILYEYGTDEQKEKFLLPLVNGDIRSCFSMTEPELAGSDPTQMDSTAVRDGDDYVINAHKWYTTAAEGAAFSIVMAVTNPDAPPHERASMIIVPTDNPGFNLVRNISVMGHTGRDFASHGEVIFRNCRVPKENMLGEEGQGFRIAQSRLGPGRIHHCMRFVGICERSFDLMCRRAATRKASKGEFLMEKQIIQSWIAESRAQIDAARLMVLNAAWKIDNIGFKEARIDISLIKFFVAGVMQNVVDRALQVHGGLGMSDDTIISHFARQERAGRIFDGPDEVHKEVVSRRIMRQYLND
jgi:acyl-CoA dehydrogenase